MTLVNVVVEIPEWLVKEVGDVNVGEGLGDLESEKPVLKVGKYVLHGHYEDFIGTGLIFEPTFEAKLKATALKRIVFDESRDKVMKKISTKKKMQRISVIPNNDDDPGKNNIESEKNNIASEKMQV